MTLGLSRDELEKIFRDQSDDYYRNTGDMPKISISGEYELNGFTPIQSQSLAKLALKMIGANQALLTAIALNNSKIENQLEQKGKHL